MDTSVKQLFSQIQTYPELCEANIRFLKGELPMTPYHLGPIDEETVPLVKKLVEINRRGFLTVNGQPALRKTTFLLKKGAWYRIEQRPYLEGYLPKIYVDAFRVWMESEAGSEYVYNMYEFRVRPRTVLDRLLNRPLQFDVPFLEGTTPRHSYRFNVTREQLHPIRKHLRDAPFGYPTGIPRDEAEYDFYAYPNLTTFLVPDTVKVVIMGTEYGKGDTEKFMLEFLKAIL